MKILLNDEKQIYIKSMNNSVHAAIENNSLFNNEKWFAEIKCKRKLSLN